MSMLWVRMFGLTQAKVLMLGLDGAGKSSLLYRLKLGEVITTIPTIGFNVECVKFANITFTVWDIGGQDKLRRLWHHYFEGADALVFVIDSSDRGRMDDAGKAFHKIVNDSALDDTIILVFANKQDLPNAYTPSEVADLLKLALLRQRTWKVQGSCVPTGDGLETGMDWLSKALQERALA